MRNRLRFLLLFAVLIIVDAAMLQVLITETGVSSLIDRLISLGCGFAAASLTARFGLTSTAKRYPAGFWPLVIVGLLLSYGIFAALAARAPHVQPLVHLAVAWIGTVAFGAFGIWRIGRWKD